MRKRLYDTRIIFMALKTALINFKLNGKKLMNNYMDRKVKQRIKRNIAQNKKLRRNERFINKIWLKIQLWLCPYGGKTFQIINGKSILIKKEKYLKGKTYIVYDKYQS